MASFYDIKSVSFLLSLSPFHYENKIFPKIFFPKLSILWSILLSDCLSGQSEAAVANNRFSHYIFSKHKTIQDSGLSLVSTLLLFFLCLWLSVCNFIISKLFNEMALHCITLFVLANIPRQQISDDRMTVLERINFEFSFISN